MTLVGGRGGFYAVEGDQQIRISWMTEAGDVKSQWSVPAVVSPFQALTVRPIRDPEAPTGIAALWLDYEDHDGRDVRHAVSAAGQTLWTQSDPPRIETLTATSDGEVFIADAGYPNQPVTLLRIGDMGETVWTRTFTPTETWEALSIESVVPAPAGGYWAIGRRHGDGFGHLVVLVLDAEGREVSRQTPGVENVRSVLHARRVGDDLALLVGVGESWSVTATVRSLLIDGDDFSVEVGDTSPAATVAPVQLIETGDGRLVSFAPIAHVGCSNAAGGCFGDLGYSVQVLEIIEAP